MDHHDLAVIRGDRKNPSLRGPALEEYNELYRYVASVWKDCEENRFGAVVEPLLQWAKRKTFETESQYVPCTAGNLTGVVYANGDVSVCENHPPLGNLRQQSFFEIWDSRAAPGASRIDPRQRVSLHERDLSLAQRRVSAGSAGQGGARREAVGIRSERRGVRPQPRRQTAQRVSARPRGMLPSLAGVALVCPLCRGELAATEAAFRCHPCDRDYPVVGGIPDFRIFPDPYLGFAEDAARTERVRAALPDSNLEQLLEYYWSLSDITPPLLRRKFIRGALAGASKARRHVGLLKDAGLASAPAQSVLEIGSGTGAFLAAASRSFERTVGIDIAMRWLHVSRRRFMDEGLEPPPLVCCCAEHLPFPDGSFDLAVSFATLEFVRDPGRVLGESARVLTPRGSMLLSTVNRYSLAREPHCYLWGVGFLPRRWQSRYVRWRRDIDFEKIRLLSLWELDRMASTHFAARRFEPADIPDEALAALSRSERRLVSAYRTIKRMPLLRHLLSWFGPEWEVLLARPAVAS